MGVGTRGKLPAALLPREARGSTALCIPVQYFVAYCCKRHKICISKCFQSYISKADLIDQYG